MAKFLSPIIVLFIFHIFGLVQETISSEITGPIFIKEPKQSVAFLNKKGVRLDCSAHGVPDPEVQWLRQDGLEKLQGLKTLSPLISIYPNGSLIIHHFDADQYRQDVHATVYRCLASNTHGKIISQPVSVKATTRQQQQQLQAQVYDEYVIPGNTGVLTCHIPPFYKDDLEVASWVREDNLVVKPNVEKNGLKMAENGQLLIESISPDANTELGYWCQIRNKLTGETFLSQSAGRIKLTKHQGGVPPTISHISDFISVKLGQSAEISCAGQGFPPPTYAWKESSTGKLLAKGSIVKIKNLDESGTFVYSCIVENKFGRDERKIRVIVREPLKAYILPNLQTVNSGDKIKLKCIVNGHPVQELIWKFNGKSITESERAKISQNILEIPSASREHEGMYQCMIRNSWESIQTAAQVILGDMAPTFIETFKSKKLQPGPSISLKCISVGRPTPKIAWTLNGKSLANDNKFVLRERQTNNGTVFSSVVVKSIRSIDGGEYSCIANNKVGGVTHSKLINIYGPPMVHDMENITVAVGEDVNVKCYVSGFPVSTITWIKETKQFFKKKGKQLSYKRILRLTNVAENDEGYYVCKAANGRGLHSEKKLYINVIRKPEIAHIPNPRKHLKIGSTFSSFCSVVEGDQPINIFWLKDGLDAALTEKVDVTNTKSYALLQIHEIGVEHSGNYTCIAENKAGRIQESIKVEVAVSPKWIVQPKNVKGPLHSDVYFHCRAKGFPFPTVKWFKHTNDDVFELVQFESKNIEHFENHTIKITRIEKDTGGSYSCIVSNGIEPDLMKLVKLEVIDPLKMSLMQLSEVNDSVTLECKVSGSRTVNVQWKNSKGIIYNKSPRFTITKRNDVGLQHISTLKITHPKNGEKVTCISSSNDMSESRSILLSVTSTDVPGKEGQVDASEIDTTKPVITDALPTVQSIDRNSKKKEKLREQGDSSVGLNAPEIQKKHDYESPVKDDSEKSLKVAGSTRKRNKTDLKTLLIFVLPAVAVFVLLILLIITLITYLVTKNSNQKRKNEYQKAQYSGIDTLNRSSGKKAYSDTKSLDRRYGKLERPLPIPGEGHEANYENQYEIPDYYAGMQACSTLQYPARHQQNANSMPRFSQASL